MADCDYMIRVDGIEHGEQSKAIAELMQFIRDDAPQAELERIKDDPKTMDLGTVLGVVLGSASVVNVAYGISRWIALRRAATLTIKEADGTEIKVNHMEGRDAAWLADRLWKRK